MSNLFGGTVGTPTPASCGVSPRTVGYVVKGTAGGGYATFSGDRIQFHSTKPQVFQSVRDAIEACGTADYTHDVTIEKAVETTYTETRTEYVAL